MASVTVSLSGPQLPHLRQRASVSGPQPTCRPQGRRRPWPWAPPRDSCSAHNARPAVPSLPWRAAGGLRGGSGAGLRVSGDLTLGYDLRALVAGSGPGLYVLPSTVGYINHDCTRVAGPAYSLLRRPSEGKPGRGGGGGGPLGDLLGFQPSPGASPARWSQAPWQGLLAPRLLCGLILCFPPEEQNGRGHGAEGGPVLAAHTLHFSCCLAALCLGFLLCKQ